MQRLLFAVVLSSLGWQQASAPAAFDPAGKWTFTTTTDQGAPMNGTFEVIGTPGQFKGQAVTSEGRTLPVRSVMTSPNGLTSLVSSAAVVVKGRFPIYNILLIFLSFPCWQCTQITVDVQVIFRADLTDHSHFVTRLDRTCKVEV